MSAAPTATVVVVSRSGWSWAPATLERLLARTDQRHPVVVVDGAAPRHVAAAFDAAAAAAPERVRVVRRDRFLAGNEARNLGADGAQTEWVAFVENDSDLSDGWLDVLLTAGEEHGAATVYPAYLERGPKGPTVHGIGADLEVGGPLGAQHVRERQHHHGERWSEVGPTLAPAPRVQAEPHATVVRRELLEQMGGLDEALLSWFDHIDLALHHRRLGAPAWFVPAATCLYLWPPRVTPSDVASLLLRWSEDWYLRSLAHLCDVWGLDPNDSEWDKHAGYRIAVRNGVPTRWRRVNALVERSVVPVEEIVTRRWARAAHLS